MSTNPEPSSSVSSLRLSCDRCRNQKLKCSVPEGSNICQRCTKAQVECVFGRRAPSKRILRREQHIERRCSTPQSMSQPPIPTPISPSPPKSGLAMTAHRTTCFELSPNLDVQLEGSTDSESASCYAQPIWGSPALSLQATVPEMLGYSDIAGYNWLNPGLTMTDVQSSQPTPLDSMNFAQVSPPGGITDLIDDKISLSAAQRLTTLISEIQLRLTKLVNGPWHKDDAGSLEGYPVGDILDLSQRFKDIICQILGRNASQSGDSDESGSDDVCHGTTSLNAAADMPTMLHVMCGYMWLVRTYNVVLGHFQKHLKRILPNKSFDVLADSPRLAASLASSALCLGELPCSNATLSLQQIHIALRMLLDVLHGIESHLGRGAGVARDMAVTLLVNAERCPNDSSHELEKKAVIVKQLLRERMGL